MAKHETTRIIQRVCFGSWAQIDLFLFLSSSSFFFYNQGNFIRTSRTFHVSWLNVVLSEDVFH